MRPSRHFKQGNSCQFLDAGHANETTAVVFDGVSGEIEVRRIARRPEQVLAWLETVERPFQAV